MNDRMTAQQLKNSILQMAVQGKLVEQNPNDEPASVLLERIREEKEKLIKEGKIKRNKKESIIFKGSDNLHYEKIGNEVKCIEDELPFEIPESWEWHRWGEISFKIQYGYNAPAKQSGKIKMVRISDIQNNSVIWDTVPFCKITHDKLKEYQLNKYDILFARTGGTVGKSFLLTEVKENTVFAGYLIRTVYDYLNIHPNYLKYFMESDLYWSQLKSGTIATAQPNCNGQTLSNMLIPIPPKNEQDRIVKKLNKLSDYISKYGLVENDLYTLNSTYKEQLKKSILQHAIEGKLVKQNPNDESVERLLEKISVEKTKLISEGKIKKAKNESYIFKRDNSYYENINGKVNCIDDEIPFEIHQSWQWIRLKNISTIQGGKRIPAGRKLTTKNTGHIYIRVTDMQNGSIDQSDLHYIENDIFDCIKKYTISCNDLYITVAGTIGRIGVIPSNLDGANLTENANKIVFSNNLINKYWLYDTLNSPYIQNQINFYTTKVGQPKLAIKRIENILIALPPTDEQKRISREMKKIESILK